jgi:hypothetical protein
LAASSGLLKKAIFSKTILLKGSIIWSLISSNPPDREEEERETKASIRTEEERGRQGNDKNLLQLQIPLRTEAFFVNLSLHRNILESEARPTARIT